MAAIEPEWLEAKRRASGIWLDEEGTWRFGTGLVENERVAAMFDQGLEIRADGELILHVGQMWCYIQARKAIYFVTRATPEGAHLRHTEVVLPWSEAKAAWGPDERLYMQWPGLKGPALCLRTPHQFLQQHLVETEDGLELQVFSTRIPVTVLTDAPAPNRPLT